MKELRNKGLGLAVISYDAPEIIAAFSKQRGITFPMLADVGSDTIKRYGILNTVAMELLGPNAKDPALADDMRTYVSGAGANPRMAGMAFPGTFVLDRNGRVASRFFEDLYITRNTSSSIMMRAGAGTRVQGTKISTAHLDLTTHPSDDAIAPGNRITLAVEVTPHRGIHLYAPGAASYQVVALNIESQPLVTSFPTSFPPSRMYFFKPLNERVPVYENPFTLMEDIELEGTPKAQAALRGADSITVRGTFDYQACNDTLCFNPESVPLSWMLTLRSIITERPAPRQ